MTAVPIPRSYAALCDEERKSDLFPMQSIVKNLEKDFTTPAGVRARLSRMSSQAYVEGSDFMKVFLRVRPFTEKEVKQKQDQQCMSISEDKRVLTLNAPKDSNMFKSSTRTGEETTHSYSFSKIFAPEVEQKEFFDSTALSIVEDYINGQNALVFTYGVTNAGKTYTIQGSPGNEGIMPRSVDVIFNSIGEKLVENSTIQLRNANTVTVVTDLEKKKLLEDKEQLMQIAESLREIKDSMPKDSLDGELPLPCGSANSTALCSSAENTMNMERKSRLSFLDFTNNVGDDSMVDVTPQGNVKFIVFVSFIEIYKDYIYDLLQPLPKGKTKRPALRLAEDKVPFVKGVREIQVNSREDVFKLITVGQEHLHMAETKLNHNSSRSHCILTIKTVCMADSDNIGRARVSQISFCDLAGTERLGKTDSYGERLKEAGKINTSLMILGKCIETLRHNQQQKNGENQRVVPYRESKLTRLFQKFLVGRGRACMIVNINKCSSFFDETAQVLKFSAVASEVKIIKPPQVARRSTRNSKAISGNHGKAEKNSRATIGWEPMQTPIREEEEEGEDDKSCDEMDVAWWEEKEKKLVQIIQVLKKELIRTNQDLYKREAEVRKECTEEMSSQFVTIEEQWEERLEAAVKDVESAGEKKLANAIKVANFSILQLKKERDEAESKMEELDEECDEYDKKLTDLEEKHNNELGSLREELSTVKVEMNMMQMNITEKDSEIESLKTKLVRSRRSSTVQKREDFIANLQQENMDGREIIAEQVAEMDEMRTMIENHGEEHMKLKQENEELISNFKLLKSENEKSLLEIEKLSKQNENLEQTSKDAEQSSLEVEKLSKEKDELLEKVQQSLKDVEKSSLDIAKLSKEKDELLGKLEQTTKHEEEKVKLTSIVDLMTQDTQKLEDKVKELKLENEGLRSELSGHSSANESHEKYKTCAELNAQALKDEISQLNGKTAELTAALDEAVTCAEIKTAQVNELTTAVATLDAKVERLVTTATEMTNSHKDIETALKTKTEEIENLQFKIESLETKHQTELQDLHQKHEDELQRAVNENNATKQAELKDLIKQHKVEISTVNEKLTQAEKEKKAMCADAKISATLEKQLMAEVDRLQEQLKQVKRDQSAADKVVAKRTSDASLLNQDMYILEMEKKDLIKTIDELKQEVTKLKNENSELQSKLPKLNVAEATELDKLRNAMLEMDRVQSEQQVMLEKYETSNADLGDKNDDLQKQIDESSKQNQLLTEQRDLADKTKSYLENELKQCKSQIHDLENSAKTAQQLTGDLEHKNHKIENLESEISILEEKLQRSESSAAELKDRKEEIKALKAEVKELSDSKDKELKKFREGRDRIASALETQINTQKSCSAALKQKLDEQILQNVQLKSTNSQLQAQLKVIQKSTTTLRKSSSASAILRPVKQEIISPPKQSCTNFPLDTVPESPATYQEHEMHEMSTSMTPTVVSSDSVIPPPHEATDDEHHTSAHEDDHGTTADEAPQEEVKGKRKTRQSSRKTVVKKSSSRRKKGAVPPRPSTPIPAKQIDESTVENQPLKTKRKRTTRNTSTEQPQIKCEPDSEINENDDTLTNEILDDSGMLKATGQPRGFPESTMEMDVTPKLKKTGTRGRKRTLKSKEDGEIKSDASNEAETTKTRSRRRGKVVQETEEPATNKIPNMARMGDILKNSPVGQALKRFEAAISPSRSPTITSPATALNYNDQNRQSTRRVRKLHADDISLPLECTPNENSALGTPGRGVAVLSQTQNVDRPGSRRLRKRK